MPEVVAALDAAARLAGGTLEVKHNYNGWRPDLDSQLLAVARTVYERLFGEPPVVTAIHAGLETSVIGSKVTGHLDMLAIGPQIEGPHSPDERVSIPTVERFWKLLVGIVDELLGGKELGTMRGSLAWIVAIVAGVAGRARGHGHDRQPRQERRDRPGRRVGAERLRRGRHLARRDGGDRRGHPHADRAARRERRSRSRETPQGRTRLRPPGPRARRPGDRDAGHRASTTPASRTPPQGEEAAEAGLRLGRLVASTTSRTAQDSLDEEADTLEEAIEQLTERRGTTRSDDAHRAACKTLTDVARLDPELAAALP